MKKLIFIWFFTLFLFSLKGQIEYKILPGTLQNHSVFGEGVSIHQDRMIVSARGDNNPNQGVTGRAYVFDYQNGTAVLSNILEPDISGLPATFGCMAGYSISLSENRTMIGSYLTNPNGNNGSAFIFEFDGLNWSQAWIYEETGTSSIWTESVSIDGNYGFMGLPFSGNGQGKAVMVDTNYNEQPFVESDDTFGNSVAVHGDYAAVTSTNSNLIYVYKLNAGTWGKIKTISGYEIGQGVALSDDFLVAGGGNNLYIFRLDAHDAPPYIIEPKPGEAPYLNFGYSVDIAENNALIVGATDDGSSTTYAGKAFVFFHNGLNWDLDDYLILSPAEISPAERYGYSVSISNGKAIVGAPYYRGTGDTTGVAFFYDCVITTSMSIWDASSSSASDGRVDLTPLGAKDPVTFNWSNGATTEDLVGVPAGTYVVEINDGNGCTIYDTAVVSYTKPLVTAEYFFDSDPGIGNGTPVSISGGDTINDMLNVSVSGLSPGFHMVFFRFKNEANHWSLSEGRRFYIQPDIPMVPAPQLTEAEYFFDTDPGIENGMPFSITSGDTINEIYSIPLNGLSPGFHMLFVRFRNDDGYWSLYEGRRIYVQPDIVYPPAPPVVAAEYFFDTDPGIGNGTPVSLTSADTIDQVFNMPVSGLADGFHCLFIRFLDDEGHWSLYEGRRFFIQPDTQMPPAPPVAAAEYFFDTDPGVGNGTPLTLNPADTVQVAWSIPPTGLQNGNHYLYIRVIDEDGNWSISQRDDFFLSDGLQMKVFLEGPFAGSEMNTTLNPAELPAQQPYNTAPWNYNGGETMAGYQNPDVVDWVLLEMRETTGDATTATSDSIVSRQAVLLTKTGEIIGCDGNDLSVKALIDDNLYGIVWHRNHLGVMSAGPLSSTGGIYSWDFSAGAGQAYGGILAHKEIAPGVWGMVSGDGDANGQVNNNDKNEVWAAEAGLSGYYSGDFNMDVQVNNSDKIEQWIPNSGSGSQVPD